MWRANALQREGRARRVISGVCFHLFSSHGFEHHLQEQPIPGKIQSGCGELMLYREKEERGGQPRVFVSTCFLVTDLNTIYRSSLYQVRYATYYCKCYSSEGWLEKSAIMITFGIKIMSVEVLLDVFFYASLIPMIDSFSCIPGTF